MIYTNLSSLANEMHYLEMTHWELILTTEYILCAKNK